MSLKNRSKKSKLLELYGSRCFYCGTELPIESLDIEHVIPRISGGNNNIENLRLSCTKCNSSKGVYSLTEWAWRLLAKYEKAEKEMAYCKRVLEKLADEDLI